MCSGITNVSVNAKLETPPHPFQRSLEHSPLRVCRKQRATMVAAERHEMTVSGLVKTLQSPWHGRSLCLHKSPLKPKTGLNGAPADQIHRRSRVISHPIGEELRHLPHAPSSSGLKRPTGRLRRLKVVNRREWGDRKMWLAKQCINPARGGDQNSIQLRNI